MTAHKRNTSDAKRVPRSNGKRTSRLVAPEVLDMRAVRSFKSSLDALYCEKQGCEIDVCGVKKVSTGCIQLLASFVKTMHAAKLPVSLSQPSAPLAKGIEELGLAEFFSLHSKEA